MVKIVKFKLFCLVCGKKADFLKNGSCEACLTRTCCLIQLIFNGFTTNFLNKKDELFDPLFYFNKNYTIIYLYEKRNNRKNVHPDNYGFWVGSGFGLEQRHSGNFPASFRRRKRNFTDVDLRWGSYNNCGSSHNLDRQAR